ncbi:MAG: short-chain dehydrogenase [Actinobacteria bacterium 13_2_20CM_2_71_6]|nr:MAG: short-chain dehydrogenase [Actinobacteria bacterium 13_2_20CM_2_71_6]
MTLDLTGRVAVVTGATRGLGRAIAGKLHASGCHVYLNYRGDDAAAAQAAQRLGPNALPLKGDVTDPTVWPALLDTVLERHSRIDMFVHNAASWHPMPAVGADVDGVHGDLAVALDPLLRAAPVLAKAMDGGSGRIVAVSSSGAGSAVPQYVSLGLAKAALESLVRYLAVELAGAGITVNAVSTAKLDKGAQTPNPQAAAVLAHRTPGGRLTTPADVADAVALLCTPEAGWIQGQVLTVDGGLALRS